MKDRCEKPSLWASGAACSTLGLLHFLFYKFFGLSYYLQTDNAQWIFPTLSISKRYLLRGELPLWQNEIYGGFPLFLLGTQDIKILPLLYWLNPLDLMMLHTSFAMALGGLAFGFFAVRLFRARPAAAAFASVFWILSGFYLEYYYDLGFNIIGLWLPVFATALVYAPQFPKRSFAILCVGACDIMHTGRFDSIEFGIIGLVTFMAIYRLRFAKEFGFTEGLKAVRSDVVRVGFSYFIGILLCFPFFYEQFLVLLQSARAHTGIDPHQLGFSWINFLSWLPGTRGVFFEATGSGSYHYVGLAGFLMIALALYRDRRLWPFLLVCFFLLFFFLEIKIFHFNPFTTVFRRLPGHHTIRHSERILQMYYLMLAPLIIVGAQEFFYGQVTRWQTWLIRGFAAFSVGLLLYFGSQWGWSTESFAVRNMVLVLFALNVLFFVLAMIPGRRNTWICASMILVLFAGSYAVNLGSREAPRAYFDVVHNAANEEMIPWLASSPGQSRFMVATENHLAHTQFLIARGIEGFSGYQTILPLQLSQFATHFFEATVFRQIYPEKIDLRRYGIANVRYWILPPDFDIQNRVEPASALRLIHTPQQGNYKLYETTEYLPRFYLAHSFRQVPTDSLFAEMKKQTSENYEWFRTGLFLEGPAQVKESTCAAPCKATVNLLNQSSLHQSYQIESESPVHFVVNDGFDPSHWRVEVNGKPALIQRANGMFRAVALESGSSHVQFFYRWPIWQTFIALATWLALLVYLFTKRFSWSK